jgi:4-amino-4-deoxy-L-arabinose transferase-like glycosyltransferase
VGHQPWAAILLQLVLGSLTPVAVYLLARELLLPHRAGLLAGLIVALDPVSAMGANRMLTETLFTLLLVTGIWLVVRHWRTLGWRWGVAAGVVLALAALTRPISQFLPIALLPLYAFAARRAGWRAALGAAALFLAVSLPLTYSWAARNYAATGLFTLSTISDTNLIYYRARAVYADVNRVSQDEAWERLQAQVEALAGPQPTPGELTAAQRAVAIEVLRGHPAATVEMLAKGVGRMVADPGYTITCTLLDRDSSSFECFPGTSSMNEPGMAGAALGRVAQMSPVQLLALAWSATLLAVAYPSALVGAWALVRERRWLALALLLLLVGYFVGLAAGAEANSRFRVPALPFIALFAGVGMHTLRGWLATRRARRIDPTAAAQGVAN